MGFEIKKETWILVLYLSVLINNKIYVNGLSTTNDDRAGRKLFGGYRITPKFCRASKTLPKSDPRSHGPTICMFNHECTQRQGEVVGACMDGFLFGACCQLQGSIDTPLLNNPDETAQVLTNSAAALSYENYGNQQSNNLQTDNNIDETYSKPVITHEAQSNNGGSVINNVYESSIDLESGYDSGNTIYISNSKRPDYLQSSTMKPTIETLNKIPATGYINNDSVIIPSASPLPLITSTSPIKYNSSQNSDGMYLPSTGTSHEQNYSQEVPAHIPTGPYGSNEDVSNQTNTFTSDALVENSNENINEQGQDFTHSDISHPGFDAVLLDEIDSSLYSSSSTTERFSTEKSMPSTETDTFPPTVKFTYVKPGFKPKTKPTKSSINSNIEEGLVLVQTISNNKKPISYESEKPSTSTGAMSDNDIESIESIILMLNDTKTGPQYNSVDSSATATEQPMDYTDTTSYSSSTANIYSTQITNSGGIDYNKYGQNSHFITTKLPTTIPHLTANGYVYSTQYPPTISEPMYVQSTSASSYGTVTPQFLSTQAFQSPTTGYGQSNIHPILLTSSSFRPHPSTHLPTTSYIIGDSITTKRPSQLLQTTIITKKPTIIKKTKKPTIVVKNTKKPPSTSYVTGPTTPKPYPTNITPKPVASTNTQATLHNSQTPTVIVLGPTYNDYSATTEHLPAEHIVQSKPIKQQSIFEPEPPTPTIHITPKPTVNLATSSTWTQKPNIINKYTSVPSKQPVGSYIYTPLGTYRPALQTSTPAYVQQFDYGSPINYGTSSTYILPTGQKKPINQQNGIYRPGFYSTQRPSENGPVFSAPGYGMVANPVFASPQPYPGFFGSTVNYPQSVEYSTLKDDYFTSPNDVNNFPPVRNPNLNVSAATYNSGQLAIDEYDFSTPHFVENDALNDKMGLLVSKIVESLQDNFDDLADVVYESNKTSVQKPATATTIITTRPTIATKRPVVKITTKKPIVRPLADDTVGSSSGSKPTATNSKPTVKPTTKRPTTNKLTTRKPTSSGSQNVKKTTKKPLTTISTKKPLTKASTTRRPTTKPTKRIITTTIQQDDDEEDATAAGNSEGEDEDDDEDVGEETETTTSAFSDGKIQCGVRPHVKSGRIVGGKAATFGEFPWQVLVRESTWLGLFTKNKCGGVLISKNYVVTAAHCQPGFLASLVAVFGEFDISGDLEQKRSVTKNVKRVVVHREYDAATFENDLALLELESPIHYDTHIVPICMPPDSADFTGRMATVTGWGRLKYGGGVPSVLQEVQVPIIENSVCQEMFHTAGHNKKILPSFLCAGYANGQKDSCEGDSGGPLVLQRSDGHWELAGTVSHGIKCAAPYLPGVYMRTTYYKPWLQSVTGVH